MSDSVQVAVTAIGFKTTGSGSPALTRENSNLGADRISQLEAAGFEMGRSGRSFVGGHSAIAGGVAPSSDLPTTTSVISLFNSCASTGNVCLVVKRISFAYASGTIAAYGSSLFAGVSPFKLATALTGNGSNIKTQATRGTGTPKGLIDVALTITQPTWSLYGGIAHGAATTMCIGYSVDLSNCPFIVPPQGVFSWGVLGAGASTPLFMLSVAWDEVEAVLP